LSTRCPLPGPLPSAYAIAQRRASDCGSIYPAAAGCNKSTCGAIACGQSSSSLDLDLLRWLLRRQYLRQRHREHVGVQACLDLGISSDIGCWLRAFKRRNDCTSALRRQHMIRPQPAPQMISVLDQWTSWRHAELSADRQEIRFRGQRLKWRLIALFLVSRARHRGGVSAKIRLERIRRQFGKCILPYSQDRSAIAHQQWWSIAQ